MFSHPYLSTPVAVGAVVNPLWTTALSHIGSALPAVLQILGGVYLVMQIYYLYKNKGKK